VFREASISVDATSGMAKTSVIPAIPKILREIDELRSIDDAVSTPWVARTVTVDNVPAQ
jgi:hypothetical protein